MKRHMFVVVFLLLVSSFLPFPAAQAQLSQEELAAASFSVQFLNERERNISNQLRQPGAVDYFQSRFEDVVEEFKAGYKINIQLHESAEDNGLDYELLITEKVSSRDAATPVSGAAILQKIVERQDVTLSLQNETLLIVSTDYAAYSLDLRIYDCSKKMLAGDNATKVQAKADQLIEKIQQNVDPDSWADTGGNARIRHFDGKLIVRQTWVNHEKIETVLSKLDR